MKKEKFTQMTEPLTKEIETIILTQGKPYRLIISNNKLLFTIYEVRIKGIKWFGLVAYEDAFKLLGENKKESGLLLIGQDKGIILREVAKMMVSFEDRNILVA